MSFSSKSALSSSNMSIAGRAFNINMLLLVVVISAAVTVLLIMIRPLMNHFRYIETLCTFEYINIRGVQNCSCGWFCTSQMPCGQIFVSYDGEGGARTQNALLYEDELCRKKYPLCSVYTSADCFEAAGDNLHSVARFLNDTQDEHGDGSPFPCLYVPGDAEKGNVILRHNPSMHKILVLITVSWTLALVDLLFHFILSAKMGLFKKVNEPLHRKSAQLDNHHHHHHHHHHQSQTGGSHSNHNNNPGSQVGGSNSDHQSNKSSHRSIDAKKKLAKPSSGKI